MSLSYINVIIIKTKALKRSKRIFQSNSFYLIYVFKWLRHLRKCTAFGALYFLRSADVSTFVTTENQTQSEKEHLELYWAVSVAGSRLWVMCCSMLDRICLWSVLNVFYKKYLDFDIRLLLYVDHMLFYGNCMYFLISLIYDTYVLLFSLQDVGLHM